MNYPKATVIDSDDDEDEYENENGAIGLSATAFGPNINKNNQGNSNRKVVTLGNYDPQNPHRSVGSGLHLQGKCLNPNCKIAYGQMVWWKVGYGQFIYSEAIFQCECPVCNEKLGPQTITNIGYRYAKVTFTGRKLEGKKYQSVVFSDEEKSGKFIKFVQDGNKNNTAMWISLRIVVEKI